MQRTLDDAKALLDAICAEHAFRDSEIMQGVEGERLHALDVLSWTQQLNPAAPLALGLAALFHDIDRVVTPGVGGGFHGDRSSSAYLLHKKRHARRSAEFMVPLLRQHSFPAAEVVRAEFLILHHDDAGEEIESFGDADLDCLATADCLAFFSSIAPKLLAAEGPDRLRVKIAFMVAKLPESARSSLWEHRLQDPTFEVLKNEVLRDYYLGHGRRERAYKYCPSCAQPLARRLLDGQSLLACDNCDFVFWNPPFPVTSVIVEDRGMILLVKRAASPLRGYWCLPGGYIRYSETPQQAAAREAKEETGLDVRIDDLVGVYQIDNDPRGVNLDMIWTALVIGGEMRINEESIEARYFNREDLPSRIAYKHEQAIADCYARKMAPRP